jgi:type IV pilus biogenesis protein CpaD/CtpE
MKVLHTILCVLFLAAAAGLLAGCATDNSDSSIPWNTPQDWEGPMPSTINQGR